MTAPKRRASLLGGADFFADGAPVALRSKKLAALAAYLLSQRRAVPREKLAGLFWGAQFDRQAAQNLRQALTRLRRAFGADVIEAERDAVAIRARAFDCDVALFEAVIAEGDPAALPAAADLYRGDFLDGLDLAEEGWRDWVEIERARLRALALGALDDLAANALQRRDYPEALARAERALEIDPLSETAHRARLAALGGLDRRGEAARAQRDFADRLRAELGVAPSGETVAVFERVRKDAPAGSAGAEDEPRTASIALLPFRAAGDGDQARTIAEGLVESVAATLAKISGIHVVATASTASYRDGDAHPARVGREQGVRSLLSGSVQVVGDRLRVTAALIDAASAEQIWAERYDRPLDDLLAVLDELTKEIVTELQIQLSDGEQARIWARSARDVVAWEAVVRATALIHSHHREGMIEARRLARVAAARDPGFAAAWAAEGWTHWLDGRWDWTEDREASLRRALELAEKALSLDPESPDARSLKAVALAHLGAHDAAVVEINRAVALAPAHAHIAALASYLLRLHGEPRRAIALAERAIRLSPVHPPWYLNALAAACADAGEHERAERLFRESVRRDPDVVIPHAMLATLLGGQGRLSEARAAVEAILSLDPDFSAERWCSQHPHRDRRSRKKQLEALLAAGAPA